MTVGSSNHSTAQLIGASVVSGAVVASVILGYQRIRREHKVESLKHSIPGVSTTSEQLNEFGLVTPNNGLVSKEDERSAAMAARALRGDYDEGTYHHPSIYCFKLRMVAARMLNS